MACNDLVPALSPAPGPNLGPAVPNPEGKQDVDVACRGKDGPDPGSQILGQLCPAAIGFHGPHARGDSGPDSFVYSSEACLSVPTWKSCCL